MAVTAYIDRLKKVGVSLSSINLSDLPPASDFTSSESLASLHIQNPYLAKQFLTAIYTKLKRHYEWFRTTQRGEVKEWGREARSRSEAYRWRGRTEDHVLTSGLDDYPRAKPPHLGELHLDLISWMGFFTKTMGEIAEFLGEEDDQDEFEGNYEAIVANIEGELWSLSSLVRLPLTLFRQIFIGAKRSRCTATPVLTRTASRDSREVTHVAYFRSRRREHPRLPQRLHLSLPLPTRPPPSRLPAPRLHSRHAARPPAPVVAIRDPKSESARSFLRAGRELLAGTDLDPDELHGAFVVVQGEFGRTGEGREADAEPRSTRRSPDQIKFVRLRSMRSYATTSSTTSTRFARSFFPFVVVTNEASQEYERTGYVWEQYHAMTGRGQRRLVLRIFLSRSC